MSLARNRRTCTADGSGCRFGNEHDQNFCGLLNGTGAHGTPLHLPAWLIADRSFLKRQGVARWLARHDKSWLIKAPDLRDLAAATNLPADRLVQTVASFNEAASGRVEDRFGRENGDEGMRPIVKPPFVAVRFNRSFMSTKGGPRTDAWARVKRGSGEVITGLYCAGVAMANPIGTKAIGAGTTIGPNMTWGYIAGMDIARRHGSSDVV